MKYLGILLIAGFVSALEIPSLLRQGERRTVAAVVAIMLLATAHAFSQVLRLPIPTISEIVVWLAWPLVPR